MPFDIDTNIQRNEILSEGEIINAYSSHYWSGRLLGNIKLLRRVNPQSSYEEWWVEYITGDGNSRYHTTKPQSVPAIGN